MTPFALALLAITVPQDAPPATDKAQEIVVLGKMAASERALAECIKQRCAAAQDIKATLRHAENQFVAGQYTKAFATLREGRNRTYGRRNEVPAEYADLMRATGFLARNLGEDEILHTSAMAARDVLADNRPANDPLLLAVSLEVGDMYLRIRDSDNAEEAYRQVQAKARAAGNTVTEAAAMLRLISLYSAKDPRLAVANLREARQVAAEMAARPEPAFRRFDPVAQMMVARMAAQQGDESALDAAVANYSRQVGPLVPVVASAKAPQIDLMRIGGTNGTSLSVKPGSVSTEGMEDLGDPGAQGTRQTFKEQWVDVSFWVRPDGSVADAAIIRRSKSLTGGWEIPVLASVIGRRYVPLALEASDPGLLRIERYTLTAPMAPVTGSRIRGRSTAAARLVMADLSPVARRN